MAPKRKKILLIIVICLATGIGFFFFLKKKPTETSPVVNQAPAVNQTLKTLAVQSVFYTDMEDPDPSLWLGERSADKSFSGKFSNKVTDKSDFGITFLKKGNEIPNHWKIKQVRISMRLFCNQIGRAHV